jgi:hypothetical protein
MTRTTWSITGRTVLAALLVAVAVPASAAQEYTVRMNGANGPLTVYVSPKAVRRAEPGFSVDTIYRLAEGKVIYLDHKNKTYSEATLAELREHTAKAAGEMSPQQKAMLSKMAGGAAAALTKTGPGETIAGFATERYTAKTPMVETEILAAPALSVPAGYYEMARASAGTMGAAFQGNDAMKTVNGMILKRTGTMTMNKVTTTELATAVDTAPIPASTFEPPAGYKKVPKNY